MARRSGDVGRGWGVRALLAMAFVVAASPAARADTKHACIAAADSAQKVRDEGRYRRAAEMFAVCARTECPLVVAASCARWQAEAEAATPTFVAMARDERGARVGDARLSIDGERVELLRDDVARAVDPGEHVLRFERDGSVTVDVRVRLRAGEKDKAVVAVLKPTRVAVMAAAPDVVAASSSSAPKVVTTLSLVSASLLAAGAAVYLDGASRRARDTAATYRADNGVDACAGDRGASAMCASWSDAVDAQNRDAVVSRGLFVGAGALAVSALVTWLVWPHAPPSAQAARPLLRFAPRVASDGVGASALGSF